jgi:hypothetical protein
MQAATVTAPNNRVIAQNVRGSKALTPKSNPPIRRVSASAPKAPATTPAPANLRPCERTIRECRSSWHPSPCECRTPSYGGLRSKLLRHIARQRPANKAAKENKPSSPVRNLGRERAPASTSSIVRTCASGSAGSISRMTLRTAVMRERGSRLSRSCGPTCAKDRPRPELSRIKPLDRSVDGPLSNTRRPAKNHKALRCGPGGPSNGMATDGAISVAVRTRWTKGWTTSVVSAVWSQTEVGCHDMRKRSFHSPRENQPTPGR